MTLRINTSYCLVISTAEFSKAIKIITRRSKRNDPGFFEVSYSKGQMICRGLDNIIPISASGDWKAPVRVSAIALKKLANSLPEREFIQLGYLDERFYIDNFSIQAFVVDS